MSDTLRPTNWSDYVGQGALKAELSVRINAAREQHRPIDPPVLLIGPPGAGKTSLASIIAAQMNEELEVLLMPVTERAVLSLFRQFEGVVLLDELHAASTRLQEALQPACEFGYLSDSAGRKQPLGRVSIIGATTRPDKIIEPLSDRFEHRDFDPYTDEEMSDIVLAMASKAGMVGMHADTAMSFAVAACGTPRRARKFVLAYRDLYTVNGCSPSADEVMAMLRTEHDGLTLNHVRYLQTLSALGGTKGLKVVSNLMRLAESALIDLERLLITKGYVTLGDRGRELTRAGYSRLRQLDDNKAVAA